MIKFALIFLFFFALFNAEKQPPTQLHKDTHRVIRQQIIIDPLSIHPNPPPEIEYDDPTFDQNEAHVISPRDNCPPSSETNVQVLFAALLSSDYSCTESLSSQLSKLMTPSDYQFLLSMAGNDSNPPLARRNAFRVMGNSCWYYKDSPGCKYLSVTFKTATASLLTRRISAGENDPSAMNDALWVFITNFKGPILDSMKVRLQTISIFNGTTGAPWNYGVRFRAIGGVYRIYIDEKGQLPSQDVKYISDALNLWKKDQYVAAEAAFIVSQIPAKRITKGEKNVFVEMLKPFYSNKSVDFQVRIFCAKSLDQLQGTNLFDSMKRTFEAENLPLTYSNCGITIRGGLPYEEMKPLQQSMNSERNIFWDLLPVEMMDPVKDDKNPTMILYVFENKTYYSEYMSAFVGSGAKAGGMYLEPLGLLITFDRTPSQSAYTLQELVQHEFGHYLNGRYWFIGSWHQPGWHTDQPKDWLGEGIGEVYSGWNIENNSRCWTQPLREIYRRTAHGCIDHSRCKTANEMIRMEEGDSNVYKWGYLWCRFLWEKHRHDVFPNILSKMRKGTYDVAKWDSIAGVTLDDLQIEWTDTIKKWLDDWGGYDTSTYCIPEQDIDLTSSPQCPKMRRTRSNPNPIIEK